MPPRRIHHESHTCSEQSLRILMWNASYAQKHSNYTWQEWAGAKTRERIMKQPLPVLDAISWKLTLPFQLSQIVPPLTDCDNSAVKTGNWKTQMIDVPVLGLAGCHWQQMENCRYVWMANPDIPLCDLASLNWVSHRVPSSPAKNEQH